VTELKGRRILVTGASGLMAFPVATELAKNNEVYGAARFSDPSQMDLLAAAGVKPVKFDVLNHDLSALPRSVDVVIHYSTIVSPGPALETPEHREKMYDGNVLSTGRLAARYRNCEAFVCGSTGSAYAYLGEKPMREDGPYGLHAGVETYAATKIGLEFLLRHLSVEYQMPTTLLRIFSTYGPRGGGLTQRIDLVANDLPVHLYKGGKNLYVPMYETDYVNKTIAAVGAAKAPAEIINFSGTDVCTVEDYCNYAGELLGKKPTFIYDSVMWPILADTTKMVKLLGPCEVGWREGVRRVIANPGARAGAWGGAFNPHKDVEASGMKAAPLDP
jgi:nucleoside-diphosphate-sugar epimerase